MYIYTYKAIHIYHVYIYIPVYIYQNIKGIKYYI